MSEVSVSLKLLHNSNKNLLQINAIPVVEVSLTLSFPYQYQYVNILVAASRRSLTVLRLTFDLCFAFDLLHSRKCSPLSHIYALVNAERIFIAKCFSLGNLFMLIIF